MLQRRPPTSHCLQTILVEAAPAQAEEDRQRKMKSPQGLKTFLDRKQAEKVAEFQTVLLERRMTQGLE